MTRLLKLHRCLGLKSARGGSCGRCCELTHPQWVCVDSRRRRMPGEPGCDYLLVAADDVDDCTPVQTP